MEKNKLMMVIIIALLVVLIGVIGVVSFLFMKSVGSKPEADIIEPTQLDIVELSQDQITTIGTGEPIQTNLLTGTDGVPHIMRVTISLGVNNTLEKDEESAKFIALLGAKQAVIRDMVIGVITTKTYQEVTRPDGREVLKSDILEKLQEEFNSNLIVEVNLSDYYTQ